MAVCSVCGGAEFAPFFRSREWSSSGVYLSGGVVPADRVPLTITIDHCSRCGMIRQAPGQEVKLDYTGRERDTARQLPDYTDSILRSLADNEVGPADLVLEVGSNDGTFLKALQGAGYRNLLGVEPSRHLAARASQAGFTVLNDFFGRDLARQITARHGAARAVICRHTLEHVMDPGDLVAGMAGVLGAGGLCFVEVPDTDWVISELFAHEIWDEHINYFRAESLARLLQSSGMTPLRSQRVRFRDTRNLLCWATLGGAPSADPTAVLADATSATDVADFQSRWDAFTGRLRATVAVAPRPIVAIGASHIQLNFLNFSGLDGSVDLMIDDDPAKAGRFAPLASAIPIQTTNQVLSTMRAGSILRTAFPYPAWEDRVCEALAPYGVGSINPYNLR